MTASKETPPKVYSVEFAKTMTGLAVANALPKPGLVNIPRVTPLEAIIAWGMAAKSVLNGDKK
ncbi:MAG: hypothetical protein IJQ01_09530 [Selenomonadaceae bacterium]|nr:hypothetical protein [Selenomonadaceae bacterium]MBR0103723.1 hypothetical protein [Selenomonadaceae bacterium]